jgi:hypothetical protein
VNVAMIAARVCGRSMMENSLPLRADGDGTVSAKLPWRRPPRTKAALAVRTLTIQKTLDVLERSKVDYDQPLPGKLVIDPRPGVVGGRRITFWPARGRLRIGRRPTENRGILAFQQALTDQGHRIPGFLSRAKPPKPPKVSKAERLRERQEDNLAVMAYAHAQRVESFRQTLADLDGHGIRRRDPRSAKVKRLFRRAWLRPV